MKIFLVGGALRDRLLERPVSDHDWLVVGATPEEMVARGYLPVGRDFPVFLHPETREEYALARTERKSAPGYRGFTVHAAPDVTLEQDLARRDLTVNAIALPAELVGADGRFDPTPAALADPFHGQFHRVVPAAAAVSPTATVLSVAVLRPAADQMAALR